MPTAARALASFSAPVALHSAPKSAPATSAARSSRRATRRSLRGPRSPVTGSRWGDGDRLVRHAEVMVLKGESHRLRGKREKVRIPPIPNTQSGVFERPVDGRLRISRVLAPSTYAESLAACWAIRGIGFLSAATIVAEVGDDRVFPAARAWMAPSGLSPRAEVSHWPAANTSSPGWRQDQVPPRLASVAAIERPRHAAQPRQLLCPCRRTLAPRQQTR